MKFGKLILSNYNGMFRFVCMPMTAVAIQFCYFKKKMIFLKFFTIYCQKLALIITTTKMCESNCGGDGHPVSAMCLYMLHQLNRLAKN